METDLPIIPCYEGNNCDNNFNCGGDGLLCDYQMTAEPETIKFCSDDVRVHGSCYGSDPEACNGIQSCCDESVTSNDLSCNMDSGFAKNGDGLSIGCTIDKNPFSCGEYKSSCVEFDKQIDKQVDTDNICWINGGYKIVKSECETKIKDNENMCKAMEYFCDWDSSKNICTLKIVNSTIPPFERFESKYTSTHSTLFLKKNCIGLDTNSDCIEHPGLNEEDNDRYYVNTARSSWDSQKETSVHPLSRINCVHDTKTGEKVCINLPRCQVVNTPNECGSVDVRSPFECTNYFRNDLDPPCSGEDTDDLLFVCSRTNFLNVNNTENNIGEGYVTWCKGSQTTKEYEIPSKRSQDLIGLKLNIIPITKDKLDWDNNPGNRCSNYNECETNNSETLWNKCIFDKSGGIYGVDYTTDDFKNSNEQSKILRTQGMCADETADDWLSMFGYIKQCEEELEHLGSINWGRVFGPNSETAACQYRYNWEHICIKGSSEQIVENYLCTWCPSLQCKIGSKDEICSEVVEGDNSWNRLPYCDTDSNHGNIVDNPLIPEDCDCYLPKTRINNDNQSELFDTETIVVLSAGIGLSSLVILASVL